MTKEVGESKGGRIVAALFAVFVVALSAVAAGCGGASARHSRVKAVAQTSPDQPTVREALSAWIRAHPSLLAADEAASMGADDRVPLDHRAFVVQARSICGAANMDAEAMHQIAQTPAGAVAAVDLAVAIGETQQSQLSSLHPPPEDRSKVKQLLRAYRKELDLAQTFTTDLLGGNATVVRHVTRALDAASRAATSESRKLGVGECARDATPKQPAPSSSDSLARLGHLRMGAWTASATSLRATGFADERAGDRWTRRWYFSSDCQLGYCVTVLTRETSSGAVSGRVEGTGNRYSIQSDLPIKCGHHTSGDISSSFSLVYDEKSGTLAGTEDEDIIDPACGPAVAVHRWTARPITRGAPS